MPFRIGSYDISLEDVIRSPGDFVFESGSIQEGLGNARSDVDIYIVFDQKWTDIPAIPFIFGGEQSYVDFEIHYLQDLENLRDQVDKVNEGNRNDILSLTFKELVLYYRIMIGSPLLNRAGLDELRSSFSKSKLSRILASWYRYKAWESLALANEQMRRVSGSGTVGIFACRNALDWSLDSYLASIGESYPGQKWVFEKLQRAIGRESPTFRTAWKLKAIGDRTLVQYCDEVTRFCDGLVGEAPTDWNEQELNQNSYLPKVCDNVGSFIINDVAYLVQDKAFLYELNAEGRAVWDLIDGKKSIGEIRRCIGERSRDDSTSGMLEEFMNSLESSGIIRKDRSLSP